MVRIIKRGDMVGETRSGTPQKKQKKKQRCYGGGFIGGFLISVVKDDHMAG